MRVTEKSPWNKTNQTFIWRNIEILRESKSLLLSDTRRQKRKASKFMKKMLNNNETWLSLMRSRSMSRKINPLRSLLQILNRAKTLK